MISYCHGVLLFVCLLVLCVTLCIVALTGQCRVLKDVPVFSYDGTPSSLLWIFLL